jgi:hypothetical protein
MRKRRYFSGQFDSGPAGSVAACIARQGRNPVYPRQPNSDAGVFWRSLIGFRS